MFLHTKLSGLSLLLFVTGFRLLVSFRISMVFNDGSGSKWEEVVLLRRLLALVEDQALSLLKDVQLAVLLAVQVYLSLDVFLSNLFDHLFNSDVLLG